MAEVKLLGTWASPYSRRIEVALRLKGVQFEYVEENLTDKSPLLLTYNPVHKKIPVFLHNGKPIAESLVIIEYIDETWKHNPILPKDPHEKAMARFWAKFIDEKMLPAVTKALVGKEASEGAIEEACQLLKILESELSGKKFFAGRSWGFVDIAANVILGLELVQEALGVKLFTEEKFPILNEWPQRIVADDVFKECIPPKVKQVAFLGARFGISTASK